MASAYRARSPDRPAVDYRGEQGYRGGVAVRRRVGAPRPFWGAASGFGPAEGAAEQPAETAGNFASGVTHPRPPTLTSHGASPPPPPIPPARWVAGRFTGEASRPRLFPPWGRRDVSRGAPRHPRKGPGVTGRLV